MVHTAAEIPSGIKNITEMLLHLQPGYLINHSPVGLVYRTSAGVLARLGKHFTATKPVKNRNSWDTGKRELVL